MTIETRVRSWMIWALPFVVIGLAIGWETDFGHALKRVPALDAAVVAQPVNVAPPPEYQIDGGIESRRETVERTLFNPTRRPAPPAQAASARTAFPHGQFVLTGTTMVDNKAIALLREVNGGRSRRVQQGETINGATVAEVRADRVKLTLGGDSEELMLKVAAGPRATIQPAPPVAQPGAAPAGGGAAQPAPAQSAQPPQPLQPQRAAQPAPGGAAPQPQNVQTQQAPGVVDAAEILGLRRRAARAAGSAGAQSQAAPPQ